jgi:serine protease
MKILMLFVAICCGAMPACGQDYYYYFNEKKQIPISDNKIAVYWNNNLEHEKQLNLLHASNLIVLEDVSEGTPYTVVQLGTGLKNDIIRNLTTLNSIIAIEPIIDFGSAFVASSNKFYVQVDRYSDLLATSRLFNFKVIKENEVIKSWYLCESFNKAENNSISICNYLYEKGIANITDPGWKIKFTANCVNDPDYGQQCGLANSGLDVSACNAWDVTLGRPEVTIAVIDYGIELTHTEFASNISSISYDASTNSSPSTILKFSGHGTRCAGIIGAGQNNNIQITGIAPQCMLMSISAPLGDPLRLADAFNFAVANNADVISNSYSTQDPLVIPVLKGTWLETTISNAITNGRAGLGCTVVFGVGNDPKEPVGYPANCNENIICVGAMAKDGKRWISYAPGGIKIDAGSAFGPELDVVAPGKEILTTDNNNSVTTSTGTSMACPMVAGIAGLVLSVNRCLTHEQVKLIIEASCKKVGGYCYDYYVDHPTSTWNNEMGYGLVDAFEAVQMAFSLNAIQFANITGVDQGASPKFKMTITGGNCKPYAVGLYWVKRHEILATISYPYTQAPRIVGS